MIMIYSYKKFFIVSALFMLLLGAGCNPRVFTLQSDYPVSVYNFSDILSVSHTLNSVTVRNGAAIALTSQGVTEYNFEGIVRSQGKGFRLLLRPVIEHDVKDSGYVLTISKDGSRLDSGGKLLKNLSWFKDEGDSLKRLIVYTDNHYMRVTYGCDTLVNDHFPQKESDVLGIQPLDHSTLTLYNPIWFWSERED